MKLYPGLSLLALGLISSVLSPASVAAPIEYHFSWQGSATLVQSLPAVNAAMHIAGSTADRFVTGANFDVNIGPPGGLTGDLSVLGLTGQESGLTVLRDQFFLGFSKLGGYEVDLNAAGVAGIQTYDLKTAFGPVVNAPASFAGALTFDLGASGVLAFSSIGAGGFVATAGTDGAISYDFSWTGAATLTTQLVDATFQMTVRADTDDVITGGTAPGNIEFTVNRPVGGLTGEVSGAGLQGLLSGIEIVRESKTSSPRADFLRFGSLAGEGGVFATGFPGVETYDLDRAFGPVAGPGFLSAPLDFGADGVVTFTAIRSATFEAIEIRQAAPEPGILHLMAVSLLGLMVRRKRLAPRRG
jgi:hypothetical protein